MIAYLAKDEYPDLIPGVGYRIKKIYGDGQHMELEGSSRRYDMRSFKITYKGKRISKHAAYKRYIIDKELRGE